ncbi:hypothetical protein HZC07_00080 [Candidatus Micrarchaeota archaeon]|nr:hypothetical protein [Candidatus Micrarchaeota archaeon]
MTIDISKYMEEARRRAEKGEYEPCSSYIGAMRRKAHEAGIILTEEQEGEAQTILRTAAEKQVPIHFREAERGSLEAEKAAQQGNRVKVAAAWDYVASCLAALRSSVRETGITLTAEEEATAQCLELRCQAAKEKRELGAYPRGGSSTPAGNRRAFR